jgi:hypothetical protein
MRSHPGWMIRLAASGGPAGFAMVDMGLSWQGVDQWDRIVKATRSPSPHVNIKIS